MKKRLVLVLKLAVSAGILAYLVLGARGYLVELQSREKNWGQLALASLCFLASVLVCNLRWCLLVKALKIPFRVRDGMRLGFLGYMLNFVSLGSVGGDLFKAVFLARERPGRRAESVASVVVDRVIGLYGLLVVASTAILLNGLQLSPHRELKLTSQITLVSTVIGTLGVGLLLVPKFLGDGLLHRLGRIPRIGAILARLIWAVRIYQQQPRVLALTTVMSFGVHTLSTLGIYLISQGLPGAAPSLASHFLIVPLSMLAGSLPLPLSGLGAIEAVMDMLYVQMPASLPVVKGTGFIVAIAYRAITILIAIIGFVYYLSDRAAVSRVMQSVETAEQETTEQEAAEPAESPEPSGVEAAPSLPG